MRLSNISLATNLYFSHTLQIHIPHILNALVVLIIQIFKSLFLQLVTKFG